jgi:hypothetical protein
LHANLHFFFNYSFSIDQGRNFARFAYAITCTGWKNNPCAGRRTPGQADKAAEQFNALGDEYVSAALRVSFKFETIGVLIHKQVVPMDAMSDLVGGAAILIWGKLKNRVQ